MFPFRVSRDKPVGLGPRRDRDGLPEVSGDFRVNGISPLLLSPRRAQAAAARLPTYVRVVARWPSPPALLDLGYGPKPVMACEGHPAQKRFRSKDLPLLPRVLLFFLEDTFRFARPSARPAPARSSLPVHLAASRTRSARLLLVVHQAPLMGFPKTTPPSTST